MAINKKIKDKNLQYNINREAYQHYHQVKLINMNIIHAKKHNRQVHVK